MTLKGVPIRDRAGGTKPMAMGMDRLGEKPPEVMIPTTLPAASAISAPSRAGAPSRTFRATRLRAGPSASSARMRAAPGKSAASRRLSDFETATGAQLLERSQKGVQLTPAGHLALQHCIRLFQGLERFNSELSDYSQGIRGHVRLWANMSSLTEYLPRILHDFLSSHADIVVELEEQLSGDIARALIDGIADIGVLANETPMDGLTVMPFQTNELVVLCHASHPLAKLSMRQQGSQQRLLVLAESDGRRESLLDFIRAGGISPVVFDNLEEFLGSTEPFGLATSSLHAGFAWLEKGISTTTVGLGRGFNEDLMIAMADAGGGQQYYGQTAEDLYDSFDQELSLLQAMYLRGIALKLIPAPGVIVEMLSVAPQHPDGTYKMNDLAWGAETWVGVRLHISPTAPGTLRDLLAVSITATDLQGHAFSQSGLMLQLPAVDEVGLIAMPADELVERRLLEVEFGKASDELRQLAREGNGALTRRKLQQMEEQFGHHPWLKAKMVQMRRLAEEDMDMMIKEVSYLKMQKQK